MLSDWEDPDDVRDSRDWWLDDLRDRDAEQAEWDAEQRADDLWRHA